MSDEQRAEQWWQRAVVYQVYPRSFADSDGDGVGDLRGVLSRVDHLHDLGVEVVWLSPIYLSPQDDNGYDISDYQQIDPLFGTLEDLDALLTALHARGMKLVMDLVVNHTSDEHPWFLESRSAIDSPKRDWYLWRKGRENPDGAGTVLPPNNWSSVFVGPAWEYDEHTQEFYLHSFSIKQPDLNWENAQVREAVYAMMRWWLDRGVDGFRMDVINLISKPDGLPDAPGDEPPGGNTTRLLVTGPRVHEFLAEMHREVFARYERGFLTVGEMPGVTLEDAILATDPQRRELDMVFQFEHVDIDHGPLGKYDPQPLHLPTMKASLARWQEGLAERGWNSLYFNNHDQPRAVSRWGDDEHFWRESATLLAGVLHCHRGTPYVYQGEEIGMTGFPFERLEQFRDLEALRTYPLATGAGQPEHAVLAALSAMSRDNARTPVQWDAGDGAGFTTGTPWIDLNPNHAWLNVAAQRQDPASVLAFYKKLIGLRRTEDVLTDGVFELLLPEHESLWTFTRTTSEHRLLVLANPSSEPVDLPAAAPFEEVGDGRLLLGNYADNPAGEAALLRPWEFRAVYLSGG